MSRVTWPLEHDRPVVHLQFVETASGQRETPQILADTGAGGLSAPFELIMRASDCQRYMGLRSSVDVTLGGAILGTHPIDTVRVEIPALSVARRARVVAVSDAACPAGMDGIACFRFLSAFTYGNFGDRRQFGLDTAGP